MSEEASSGSPAMILNTCAGLASIPFFYLSLIPYFTLSFSLSLSLPRFLSLFCPDRLCRNPLSTNHQTTGAHRIGPEPHRAASHRITPPNRSLSLLQTAYSPLLLGLLLTLSYPIIGYTRATPRHSFPPPVAP